MYRELGVYSDLVDAAAHAEAGAASGGAAAGGAPGRSEGAPVAWPGPATRRLVREALNFSLGDECPREVQTGRTWEAGGVAGEEVSWSVGYGPRTQAYVFKPVGATGQLPGIVALHDHNDYKFYGKEKIADGPDPLPPSLAASRISLYEGRAYANALARRGFVVVVHDVFLWGSRKFPLAAMPQFVQQEAERIADLPGFVQDEREIAVYNAASDLHEHVAEKYCSVLGTTIAGLVSYEDRVALNYLTSRPDVLEDRLGCVGLSGGGCRSALLQATCDHISAAVVAGMMSTYEGLLDHNVGTHTWMFFPAGWARHGDWPDLAACRAPSPLLVQYDLDDELFTVEGMREAHERLQSHYASVGAPGGYTGQFYPGPHKFDLEMQEAAFEWMEARLRGV